MTLNKTEIFRLVILPLLGILALSAGFHFYDWDITLAACFYSPSSGWYLKDAHPWDWLYDYGTWPGFLITGTALVIGIGGFMVPEWRKWRLECGVILLTLMIGSGLIVNTGLKQHWGRPRPRQIIQFGGSAEFLPLGVRGNPGGGNSFPSGHASMAFYWMSLYFVWRNHKPRTALMFLAIGLIYGMVMGMARMVQGGHFASDVLWAGAIMYFTPLCLSLWLIRRPVHDA